MRKLIILLVLPLFSLTLRAYYDVNAMQLQGPSIGNVTILLDEKPLVTFSDDYLTVTTHMSSVSIPSSLVTKWVYVKDDNATYIKSPDRFGSLLSFDGKHLRLMGLTPLSSVQVYTVDGVLVASATTDNHGNVSLSVPERQGAVYVVKTSTLTFKVSKP